MLYRIRKPKIKKIVLVKRPASGHTWHLLKSAPDTDPALEQRAGELNGRGPLCCSITLSYPAVGRCVGTFRFSASSS